MSVEVVCAAFDPDDDRALGAQNPPGRPAVAHRPHLTLTACAEVSLAAIAAGVAARHAPVSLVLDHVGTFGGVLWIGPRPSPALAALQRDAHESLVAAGLAPAFDTIRPDRWVPHCTLARRVGPADAAAFAERYQPVSVTVVALAVIEVGGSGDLSLVPLAG